MRQQAFQLESAIRALGPWQEGPGALSHRLGEALRAAIERGAWGLGDRLPAERALALRLGVSRTTVVAAYDALRGSGWLDSRPGRGTWVCRGAQTAPAEARANLTPAAGPAVYRLLAHEPGESIPFLGAHLPAPAGLFAQAWAATAEDLSRLAASHGYSPLGLAELREAIAAHLTERGLATGVEEVLVTSGAQQAIALAGALFAAGEAVVLEDPTYLGAIDALGACASRLIGVGLGAGGIDPDALRAAAARSGARLAYLVPSFHNPTGAVLGESERRAVARLAEERRLVVVEDATLAELSIDAEPPAPIAAFAPRAPILTVGSLSKLAWGGLRVGWIRAPREILRRLAPLKASADLGTSALSQAFAARLLAQVGALKRLRRRELAQRRGHLGALLARHLPAWQWRTPAGGLSLWVRLPYGDAVEFATLAQRHGVCVVPGPVCSPANGQRDRLRLPFVNDDASTEEGVRRLARAWEAYQPAEPLAELESVGVIV